jgi:hypothetical protein
MWTKFRYMIGEEKYPLSRLGSGATCGKKIMYWTGQRIVGNNVVQTKTKRYGSHEG